MCPAVPGGLQKIYLELHSSGERTSEQLRPVPNSAGHLDSSGGNAREGGDPHHDGSRGRTAASQAQEERNHEKMKQFFEYLFYYILCMNHIISCLTRTTLVLFDGIQGMIFLTPE